MIRRLITDRIVMLLLVVSAVDCCDATAPVANAKPHVVVILADALGWGDVGCYGGKIPTPHLDRLAGQGIRFTDSHSPSAVCSPSCAKVFRKLWPVWWAACATTWTAFEATGAAIEAKKGLSCNIAHLGKRTNYPVGYRQSLTRLSTVSCEKGPFLSG